MPRNIRRIIAVLLYSVLLFTPINSNEIFVKQLLAAGTVDANDVLDNGCIGVAETLEVDLIPTAKEIEEIKAQNAWKSTGSLVMAKVSDCVNVRENPYETAAQVGLLYNDCCGYIIEYTDSWTKIASGSLTGWVRNDYLYFGDEARKEADAVGQTIATILANEVNVRSDASIDGVVLGTVDEGDIYNVISIDDEWISVDYEGTTGYINSNLVDIEFALDKGVTLEEIAAREAAERAAKREAERYQYYGVYAATATDKELLGALIQCEAGNQPYEGMVAVGAVVMNRVRSAAYPNTIYGVIYASGQFTPAESGAVDRRLSLGVNETCLQAAELALTGYSNVGEATHFRPTSSGYEGIVISGHVFW